MSEVEINNVQPNSISYWEERQINIGQYESRKLGLSITKKTTYINKLDKKVLIKDMESVKVYPNEDLDKSVEDVMSRVQTRLDAEEFRIRAAINDYLDGGEPNLHKVKELLGVKMVDTDKDLNLKTEDVKPVKSKKKDEFDDVDFDMDEQDVTPKKSGIDFKSRTRGIVK